MRSVWRRILVLALALSMALTLAPAALADEEKPERGTLRYTEHIAPQYEDAGYFGDGELAAVKKGGKWGYIDTDGKTVIPFQYDKAFLFNEGYAIVAKNGRTGEDPYSGEISTLYELGFIDSKNNFTPFQYTGWRYDQASGEDVAVTDNMTVSQDWLEWHDTDELFFHNGIVILSFSFGDENAYTTRGTAIDMGAYYPTGDPMNEGLLPVWSYNEKGGGVVDASGHLVKFFSMDNAEYFGPKITDDWGLARQSYRYISKIMPFNQGLAPAWQITEDMQQQETTERIGFLDRSFQWVIQPQFENYFYSGVGERYQLFGDTGLAMMQKDGKYGAIDKSGKTVIPFQYEELWPVSEGLIVFRQGGKYGYLNADGTAAIPARYENASGFNNGLAVVYDGSKAFLIDKKGQSVPGADQLNPSSYFKENEDGTKVVHTPGQYVVIEKNGKYGFGKIDYTPALPGAEEMHTWGYEEVVAAIEADLISVDLQNLYLNNIQRGDFCRVVVQAISEVLDRDIADLVQEKTGKSLDAWRQESAFNDTSDTSIIAANALGIVNGTGANTFSPYAELTREQAAVMMMNAARLLGKDSVEGTVTEFADSSRISVWAKDAVKYVNQLNIMNGTGNDSFSPKGMYTREQSYIAIYRLFKNLAG